MNRWSILLVVLACPVALTAAARQEAPGDGEPPNESQADDGGGGAPPAAEDDPPPSPGMSAAPVSSTAPRCDRDVEADLLTIEDRITKGRLGPARAYVEGLIQCQEGRDDPRVFLYLAQVEELDGNLNEAHRALELARAVAGRLGLPLGDIEAAMQRFAERWVALDLVPAADAAGMPAIEHDGLVQDEITATNLSALRRLLDTASPGSYPITVWLVPGVYRIEGQRVRLPPGTRTTVHVPAGGPEP